MNAVDKLRKQVEVLREALCRVYSETHDSECLDTANNALAESDRIAAEPVEATDWEEVEAWSRKTRSSVVLHRSAFGGSAWVSIHSADGSVNFDGDEVPDCDTDGADLAYSAAAAWVRAQKEAGNG